MWSLELYWVLEGADVSPPPAAAPRGDEGVPAEAPPAPAEIWGVPTP